MIEYLPTPEPEGIPLVILPSRLLWEKGVGEFVAAARRLRGEGVEARFALVGDTNPSNPRALPESQINEWTCEGVVEWWGRRSDMPEVYAQCHIVCLPTTYGEGVPRVLLEAASCGRPIITTNLSGCREAVIDGENGIVVEAGDLDALSESLKGLIEDPQRRVRYGKRGRELAEKKFSDLSIARETLAVYQGLLARSDVRKS